MAFILAALALRIGWGLYGAGMFGAEEARAQDCNQVASFGPTTDNQTTPPFNITGNTFRLSGNVTFLGQGLPGIIITPKDEQGSLAGIVTVDQEGGFGENVLEGPGTFTLEIQTINDVEYTVNVEDCGSSPTGAPAPDETTNGPTPQPRP